MKRASLFKHLALIALTAGVAMPHSAQGAGITWGSIFEDTLLNSTASVDNPNPIGDQQLDATFSFEIGTFGGFIPTYANINEWAANWKVFDNAGAAGWDVDTQFFGGFDELDASGNSTSPFADPATVFTQGEHIYLWVYNSKDIVPTSEWALITNSTILGNVGSPWVMPDSTVPGGFYELVLAEADTAVIGGVNGVRGAGEYSYASLPDVFNQNTTTGFTIQTAVVPEPGSVLLLFSAAAAFLTRRAARRTTRSTIA